MNFEQAKKYILILKKKLKQWNYEYYINDKPSVSDKKYDQIMRQLIIIEQKYNKLITIDSPTQSIFGKISKKFNKYIHTSPILSLENAFNFDDLINFDKKIKKLTNLSKIDYICELKIDGLSISLVYDDYKLKIGATRGDGINGEDVTVNIKQIKSIPIIINQKKLITRGEIYLSIEEFNKINEEQIKNGKSKFSNTRNAAAGTLRQLDSTIVAKRKLNSFLYYYIDALQDGINTQYEVLQKLKQLKFKINTEYRYCSNIIEVLSYIKEYELKKSSFGYKIDGIVIKVNNLNLYEYIGYTIKNPKWAIAYKFPEKIVTTKLINIFPSVGRTGRITYNATLEPVLIEGTIVQSATLHNANYIIKKDIRIGDNVQIKKSGDIIPKVIKYIKKCRNKNIKKWKEEKYCPECNSFLRSFNKKNNNSFINYCDNNNCPKKIILKIKHYCSRNAMNIKGINEKIIEKLFKFGYLKKISDLYKLKQYEYEIIKLKNFGKKLFNNIIISIHNSKNNSLERLIFALGIKNVGKKISKLLALQFKTINNLIKTNIKQSLINNDIGPVAKTSIINYFTNNFNKKELILLCQKKVTINYNNKYLIQKFKNYQFVIIGFLSKKQEYFKELIESYGGQVTKNISIKTNYLLIGNNSGNKLFKAQKLNIKVINEKQFEKILK